MSVLAHFEAPDQAQADRRGSPRLVLSLGSVLGNCGSSVVIHDLSMTGLLVETAADLAPGDTIEVHLPEMGPVMAAVVWSEQSFFGCRFEQRIPRAAISAALLRSVPPVAPVDLPAPVSTPAAASARLGSRGIGTALAVALALAAIAYVALAPAAAVFVGVAAILALLLGLMFLWGFWILDNTLEI